MHNEAFVGRLVPRLRESNEAPGISQSRRHHISIAIDGAAQPERMRRIGVLSNAGESDPEAQSMVAALHQAKTAKALGLTVPANLLATADEVIE